MQDLEVIKLQAQKYFDGARGSHDWYHTLRVYNLCLHIGQIENADIEILTPAAYLHDIARNIQDESKGEIDHAIKGAQMAEELLTNFNLGQDKIKQIVHCIATHRYRGELIPQTLEAKILFDADKLDSIGAVGIGRAFYFANEIGAKLHDPEVDINNSVAYSRDDCAYREFLIKLIKIKDKMLTAEGRRLAEKRHQLMVDFFDNLNEEVKGNL